MKLIIVINKATGEIQPFGSFAAVFERYTAEELGIGYHAATLGKLQKFETEKYKFQVFDDIIKSSKAQNAGRKTATLRGLCGVGKA